MTLARKILNVRMWLLLMGIAPFTSMAVGVLDVAASVSDSWSASPLTERELVIASAGETIWMGHAALFGAVAIAMAFLTSGKARARFTALSAIAVILFVGPAFAYSGYGEPSFFDAPTMTLFFMVHVVVLLAGLLNWNNEN